MATGKSYADDPHLLYVADRDQAGDRTIRAG